MHLYDLATRGARALQPSRRTFGPAHGGHVPLEER